jgi:hypothetical protein
MFQIRDIKNENFGNVGWKPIKSRFSKQEIDDAYEAEIQKRRDMVAAKKILKENVLDEGSQSMLSSILPPAVLPSVARLCSFFEKDQQEEIRNEVVTGLVSASVNLAQWNLVPGMPPVLDREPILEKERRKDLEYTVGQLPRLRQPEDYTASAEIYNHFCHESVVEYRELMNLTCLKNGIPSIALNSDMLPTPFASNFFLSNPATGNSSAAEILRAKTESFLKSVPPDAEVVCLWGDAGKMIIQCAKFLHYDIHVIFVGTSDYPLTLYDQYLGYVNSEISVARFDRLDLDCTMRQYVMDNDFSERVVLANYVPCFFKKARMLLQISVDRGPRVLPGRENKVIRYIPSAMTYTDAANYFNMFVFTNDRERATTRLYDPVADVYFNYDHHRVWADQVSLSVGIPIAEMIIATTGDANYNGMLKMTISGEKTSLNVSEPRYFTPLKVSCLSLDVSKMMFFDADNLAYVDYRGGLPGTNKVIESAMLVAQIDGVWHLVDCDVGSKYVVRYLEMSLSNLPHIPIAVGGRFAIPWHSGDIYSVVEIKYSDPNVYDSTGLSVNRQTFRGLAISGDDIVYDGFSEFHYSPVPLYNHIKSDSKLSWKVRFARDRDNVCEGFHLQVLHDNFLGETFTTEHVGLLGLPPDVGERIKVLCADYSQGFVSS